MLTLLVMVPAIVGVVALYSKDLRVDLALLVGTASAHLLVTASLWVGESGQELDALLKLDILGLLVLSITSVIFFTAALYTIPYVLHGTHDKPVALQRFIPCLLWFLSAMSLVSVTQHLALLWAAVEGTTLASAPRVFLPPPRGARGDLEVPPRVLGGNRARAARDLLSWNCRRRQFEGSVGPDALGSEPCRTVHGPALAEGRVCAGAGGLRHEDGTRTAAHLAARYSQRGSLPGLRSPLRRAPQLRVSFDLALLSGLCGIRGR